MLWNSHMDDRMGAVSATFCWAYAFSHANQCQKGSYLPGAYVAGERLGTVSCAVRTLQQQEETACPRSGRGPSLSLGVAPGSRLDG